MYLLSCTAQKDQKSKTLMVWVNETMQKQAIELATNTLSAQGWIIKDIESATPTKEDDYFPPCASLDTFHRAEKEMIAYRIL